jgi:4-hydroxybenzoate polyprenyltransferase
VSAATAARRAAALVKAAHPGPSAAVTGVGTALGATAGAPAGTCALLALALLSGQLSIGWCNDAVDRARDVAAGRPDKPIALGRVTARAVGACAVVSLAACVPASLALGAAAGTVHLVAVGGGWAYDLHLKRTGASFVAFAVSFGLLPAVATLALPHPVAPPWWATAAGALLGVVAHLANALPDLDDDVAAGVLGLPQRLGAPATRLLAGLLLAGAALLLTLAPRVPLGPAGVALLVVTAVLLSGAFGRRWPPGSRAPFALTVVAALGVVGLLLARGASLA